MSKLTVIVCSHIIILTGYNQTKRKIGKTIANMPQPMEKLYWFFIRSGCYPAGIDGVAAGFCLGALHTRKILLSLHQRRSFNKNEWVLDVLVFLDVIYSYDNYMVITC